jgi:hypothetical protein
MKASTWLALLAAPMASYDASALGSLAQVLVIDRDTGAELSTYYYQGEYWVAGRPGARYAVEIRNCTDGRLLAVTSVDGVNVISGATAAWHQTGYVFDPWQRYQITGWRKSHEEVAAFFFTDLSNSYAARTGRPADVGVIGIALFRERPSQRVYTPPQIAPFPSGTDASAQGTRPPPSPEADATSPSRLLGQSAHAAAGTTAAAPPSGNAAAAPPARSSAAPPAERSQPGELSVPAPSAKLGTGHGAREYSLVQDTEFVRLHREPDEVIRIRYDSLENLVALGVVPQPAHTPGAPRPGAPNPFPRSHERAFVPDPPG